MLVKEQTTFKELCVEDFGLRPTDQDSHVPQFFMVTTIPKESAAAASEESGLASGSYTTSTRRLHTQSEEGKAKSKQQHK